VGFYLCPFYLVIELEIEARKMYWHHMRGEPIYTFQELITIIPIADRDKMKHINSTVTKEKSLYDVLVLGRILREISKRLRVLGIPVVMFGIAFHCILL
jgi:hypothetical protein